MARLRVVDIAPSSPGAQPTARRPAARAATRVLSAQQAWVEKQRKLAEGRAVTPSAPPTPSVPSPPMAPLPTPPVVAVEQPLRSIPEVATAAEQPLQEAFTATGEPELWFGPWLPRPGRFPMVAVDATKLAPFGAPVTLPAIDVPEEALSNTLAENLGELEPRTRLLIERLVGHVGASRARALYERTRHIENAGGIRVHDRRRTSGGVFLSLVEQQIGGRAFLQASVLAALTVGILPMPPKKRKR